MLDGKWTYRSYLNEDALVGDDAEMALALIFGEGVFDVRVGEDRLVSGALGMGTGYALAIEGGIEAGRGESAVSFHLIGRGVDGTATEGWRYDYSGVTGHAWPTAVGQVPCLLGTVVRVNAHGPHAPAGVTASFIAVRQTGAARPAMARRNALLA